MAERSTPNWTGGAVLAAGAVGGGLALWSALAARAAERMVPADGAFVDIDGAQIHYVEAGSGPTLLMVHGLMGQLRNFTYALVDLLARDFRVIAVDRPGWGHSTAPSGARPGIVEQAAMLGRFVEALDLDRPLLVGHSMGGAVSLAAALDEPERYRGLALIAPLSQPIDHPPAVFAGMAVPAPLRAPLSWTLAMPMGTLAGPQVAVAIFAPDPVPADFATRGGGALSLRPQSYRAGSFELMHARAAAMALAPRYGTLALPVSILFGRGDAVLDHRLHGEATAATIPGAQLELVDGGHMLPVTDPQATAAFVRSAHARTLPAAA